MSGVYKYYVMPDIEAKQSLFKIYFSKFQIIFLRYYTGFIIFGNQLPLCYRP